MFPVVFNPETFPANLSDGQIGDARECTDGLQCFRDYTGGWMYSQVAVGTLMARVNRSISVQKTRKGKEEKIITVSPNRTKLDWEMK